jgi:hypothetical protein
MERGSRPPHQLADVAPDSLAVHDGLVRIGCRAMAALARRGRLGDWSRINLNVSETGDDMAAVKERDRWFRNLITNG